MDQLFQVWNALFARINLAATFASIDWSFTKLLDSR